MNLALIRELPASKVGNAIEAFMAGHIDAVQFATRLGISLNEVQGFLDLFYHGRTNGPTMIIVLQSKVNL